MKILKRTGWLALACLLLAGCQTEPVQAETPEAQIHRVPTESSEGPVRLGADVISVPSESYSQALRDRLGEEWDRYDNTSPENRVLSSHLWGTCADPFDSWAAAEDFVGFPVANPLDGQDWLKPWTHFGAMGTEEAGAPVEVHYQGLDRGIIDQVVLYADYWAGELRVQFSAGLYEESPVVIEEPRRNLHIEPLKSGNQAIVFDREEGEKFVSQTAHLAKGAVLYNVYVVGESGQAEAVTETMNQILALF